MQDWLARLDAATLVSLDTETTDLDPMQARLVGISFALDGGPAAYLPLGHHYAGAPEQLPLVPTLAKLKPWLESPRHAKLGQHLKYDRHVFANHDVTLRGIAEDSSVFDEARTRVAEAIVAAMRDGVDDSHRLQQVTRRTVGQWVAKSLRRRPMIVPVGVTT